MYRRLALVLTALVLVVAACGSDEDADEAQPNPDDTQFAEGLFDEIPLMPTSEEISERTEVEGNVSQSFTVRGETPEGVMEWYQQTFATGDEWTQVTGAEEIGVDTWRSRWQAQGRLLVISASPAPTAEGDDRDQGQGVEAITQYSLSLAPEDENPRDIRDDEDTTLEDEDTIEDEPGAGNDGAGATGEDDE